MKSFKRINYYAKLYVKWLLSFTDNKKTKKKYFTEKLVFFLSIKKYVFWLMLKKHGFK